MRALKLTIIAAIVVAIPGVAFAQSWDAPYPPIIPPRGYGPGPLEPLYDGWHHHHGGWNVQNCVMYEHRYDGEVIGYHRECERHFEPD